MFERLGSQIYVEDQDEGVDQGRFWAARVKRGNTAINKATKGQKRQLQWKLAGSKPNEKQKVMGGATMLVVPLVADAHPLQGNSASLFRGSA